MFPARIVHDETYVVRAFREAAEAEIPTGQARATLIESKHAPDVIEATEQGSEHRNLASEIEVRNEPGNEDNIDRSRTCDGPGDIDMTAAREADLLRFHNPYSARARPATLPSRIAPPNPQIRLSS